MEEFEYKNKCGLPTKIVIREEPKDLVDEESKTKHETSKKKKEKKKEKEKKTSEGARCPELARSAQFFDKFKGLIVELIFSFHERDESRKAFLGKSPDDALKVVEFELSFLYEVLFTKAKAESIIDPKETRRMCSCRGIWALEERGYLDDFGTSVMVEFDESLLTWHIATYLCYYSNAEDRKDNVTNVPLPDKAKQAIEEDREICKRLSDYLVYLLVMRPFMMSSSAVIGKIRYRDTCAEAMNFFNRGLLELMPSTSIGNQKKESKTDQGKKEKSNAMLTAACTILLSVNTTDAKPAEVKGDRSKSVLFDACMLAKKLKDKLGVTKRWKIMSEVLAEMLAYAAIRCPGIAHAQRLSKGGELLTFVWFLTTHLCLGEQYLIEAGHASIGVTNDGGPTSLDQQAMNSKDPKTQEYDCIQMFDSSKSFQSFRICN
ncbi:hypothetical protein CKAN_02095800 [Cinnamomum micranthum f. kanehirae]|uniref:DUF4220 domain-containing protein n=1 Tax=Cinnamomum micranthum f. kanehirae TaxID=337451 RepID=A0A3S3P2I1_9MAGN|nr:hypothetical protein CKAN_02095800 [Cinnamomum micranthum f. kanehirae]